MAISVLGKRSRSVQDTSDTLDHLPARKRTARATAAAAAALQIFEDSERENLSKAVVDEARNASKRVSKTPRRTYSSRHVRNESESVNHIEHGEFQDENIPPVVTSAVTVTATPTKNRIRDVLGLTTPSTPKHRVRLAGTPLTPRTPRDGCAIPKSRSVFSAARQLFAPSNNPDRLVGRDMERNRVCTFIEDASANKAGGCMYISGPPGTGKSALVHEVFQQFESRDDMEISVVNCVSLQTSTAVYSQLLCDFAANTTIGKKSVKQFLSQMFLNKSHTKPHLVLLDEIDNLLDTDCDVLYTLLEWALHRSSSLILVGIANALDLTDRFLPRLKAKGLRPELLPFLPYNAAQISNIITEKLRSLLPPRTTVDDKFVPFMQPAAIQLCGKKIASQSGDLRKAFGLVRRVLEQVEQETNAKWKSPVKLPFGEISNGAVLPSPASTPTKVNGGERLEIDTVAEAPRASIAHVARIASSIFNNSSVSRLAGLNLQQKAVLCSLVSGEKRREQRNPYVTPSKSSHRTPTIKDLFAKYSVLCGRDEGILQPLKDTEFRDVIASLETLGLLHEHRGRTSSLLTPTSSGSRAGRHHDDKQVVSAVSEKEMRDSLDGAGADLLRRLLEED